MSARPDLLKTFQEQYKQFRDKRDLAFDLGPATIYDQTPFTFMLRLTRWYEIQKCTDSYVNQVFEEARNAGRFCMSMVLNDPTFILDCQQYLLDHGYAELMHAYLFTAPLDALNRKVMHKPRYDDIHFDDWSDVIGLNEAATDIHQKFLKEYARIWNMLADNELSYLDNNPFPLDYGTEIERGIYDSDPPQSIRKNVKDARSYFEI